MHKIIEVYADIVYCYVHIDTDGIEEVGGGKRKRYI